MSEAADTRYNLVFSGQLLPGTDRARAERTLAAFFGLHDPAAVRVFFSGRPVPLRRDLNREEALRLYRQLRGVGLICEVPPVARSIDGTKAAPPHDQAVQKMPPERGRRGPRRAAGNSAAASSKAEVSPQASRVRADVDAAAPPATRDATADSSPGKPPAAVSAAPSGDAAQGQAPNFFALRPATAGGVAQAREQAWLRGLVFGGIAVAISLVLILVNLRFAIPAPGAMPRGPLAATTLAGGGLALLLEDALLLHARSGLARQRIDAQNLGLAELAAPLLQSADGSLLLRGRSPGQLVWHLRRCRVAAQTPVCEILMPLPAPPAPLALRESYLGDVLFLQLENGRLLRSTAAGIIEAESSTLPPQAPATLLYLEGLLLIPAPDAPLLGVYRPDRGNFGEQLDALFLLLSANAPPARRILDAAATGDDRYALLEDEEGSRHLYRFDADWGAARRVDLPSEPATDAYLAPWRDRLLLVSPGQRQQVRIAPGGHTEASFESPMLVEAYAAWDRSSKRYRLLRRGGLIAPLLLVTALVLLAAIQAAKARALRLYPPDHTALLDPMPARIRWLPGSEEQGRVAGRLGLVPIALCAAAALIMVLGGAGGRVACLIPITLAALQARSQLLQGCGGHLGRRDNEVILVDHDGRYFYGHERQLLSGLGFLLAGGVALPATIPGLGIFGGAPLPKTLKQADSVAAAGLLSHLRHPWLRAVITLCLGVLISVGTWLLTA